MINYNYKSMPEEKINQRDIEPGKFEVFLLFKGQNYRTHSTKDMNMDTEKIRVEKKIFVLDEEPIKEVKIHNDSTHGLHIDIFQET